jgi:AraC-like DNA-binding protein
MGAGISVAYVRELASFLGEEGIATREFLSGTGVSPGLLEVTDAVIDRFACHRVLARAAELAPPGFALRLGRRMRPGHHGILGHAMMCSRTVGESLKTLERFAMTRGIPASFRLLEGPHGQRLQFDLAMPAGHLRREYLEWALMIALWPVFQDRGSRKSYPCLIELDYPRPRHFDIYSTLIDCAIEFECSANAIHFTDAALATPQQNTNIEVRKFCERRCELILHDLEASGGLADRVRNALLAEPPPLPDAETIAASLHMSSRALRRALRREDASFRVLLQQVRKQLACRYLAERELTVEEVARLLGYSEPPAFSRAFKKWTGSSPSGFRANGR